MEDFFNGLGNGLYNYEDFDIGMVRYLYKIYCWKKSFYKGILKCSRVISSEYIVLLLGFIVW